MKHLYTNFLINVAVQKSDFDIHLFNVSIIDNSNSEDNFIVYELNYRSESFIIIKIFQLFEISYTLACFVTNNFIVNAFFAAIYSFVDKNFVTFECFVN